VVDAERLLRGLSVTEVGVVTSGGTAGATTGGAGATAEATGDASPVELTAKSFSYDREYKYCPLLETFGEARKRLDESGDAAADDLAAQQATAGETPGFATWCVLVFDSPVTCPSDSLYIASRFDSDINQNSCRLAFHGKVITAIDLEKQPDGVKKIKAFKMKQREGVVERVVDDNTVIGKGMFKKETDLSMFAGMSVVTGDGEVGKIEGGFGKSGKYKVYFARGIGVKEGTIKLYLRFKRYVFDKEAKKMVQ